jgi:phosphate transport system substrate-binding protein
MPLLKILADGRDIEGVEWRFLDSPGSGSGIQGVAGGALAIGAVSRAPNADEEDLDLVYTNLSNDGVVFALHPSVGIDNLTSQQVRDIYAGVYTNWMELGGPDLPIVVLDRHEDEPSKAIMREYVFGDDLVISPRAAALYTEADMVKGLESTVGAIGYYSLGFGTSSGVAAHYPALDGVVPSVASIRDGSYHVVRPLGIVTASDPAPEVAAFVEWATSDEAKDLMESEGFAAAW